MNEENNVTEEITLEAKKEAEAAETSSATLKDSLRVAAGTPHPSLPSREIGQSHLPLKGKASDAEEEDGEMQKLREELESVRGQLARMEHERYLLSRGVPEEDLDYYAFKIEHMDGAGADFQKAAKEYLKAHPVRRTTVSSGAELGAGSARKPATSSELMNQLLREKR